MLKTILYTISLFAVCLVLTFVRASNPWGKYARVVDNDSARPPVYLNDTAHYLTALDVATIEQQLRDFKTETGIDFFISLVPDLGGQDIEGYAFRLFRSWHHNDEARKKGMLYVLSQEKLSERLEVGWGLQSDFPDSFCKLLMTETMEPLLRQSKVGEALRTLIASAKVRLGGNATPGVNVGKFVSQRTMKQSEEIALALLIGVFLTGLTWAFRGFALPALLAFVAMHPATPADAYWLLPVVCWCSAFLAWTISYKGFLPATD